MIRTFAALLIATAWSYGHAQSLPPCPKDTSVVWTNCVGTFDFGDAGSYSGEFKDGQFGGQGTFTHKDGTQYIGGWKDNKPYGQGSLISEKGYTFVEGFWRDDRTVDVNNLQWTWVGVSSNFSVFVLPESIKKVGAFRRVWVMWARAEPDQKFGSSSRQFSNFDCMNEREQGLAASAYSGSFGAGTVLDSMREQPWDYVPPGTVLAVVMKYVCEYKL